MYAFKAVQCKRLYCPVPSVTQASTIQSGFPARNCALNLVVVVILRCGGEKPIHSGGGLHSGQEATC